MKQRVLIVDDEIDTLRLLKMIVELSGYEAYTTLNSIEALKLAQVEQPDVILLDIMMPKLNGFQLCKFIRAYPETREIPVIFVTAYSALDLEDRRISSGGDMVLSKPVSMDGLVEGIEKVQTMRRNIPADIQKTSGDLIQEAVVAVQTGGSEPEILRNESSVVAAEPAKSGTEPANSGKREDENAKKKTAVHLKPDLNPSDQKA